MRGIIVSSEFPPGPGGIGTHAYQLAKHLHESGWDVLVLSPQEYATEAEISVFNEQAPFAVERLRTYKSVVTKVFTYYRSLTKWIHRWRPDLIVASGRRAVWLSALSLVGKERIRWVAIGHGSEFRHGSRPTRLLNRWAYERADQMICVSEFTCKETQKIGIKARRLTIIPNGADPAQFYRLPNEDVGRLRRKWNLEYVPMILTVGNVSARKGHDLVIRALPQVLSAVPDVHYFIAGLPTRERMLTDLAAELGVHAHVHFWGRVTDETLNILFNLCDVFVMPSRETPEGDIEGYGIVVVEAALCGKPAIGTRDSGLEEAIIHDETGLVVPQEDVNALATAIIELLGNEEKRRYMGQAAYKRAHAEQTWSLRMKAYQDVFIEMVEDSPEESFR